MKNDEVPRPPHGDSLAGNVSVFGWLCICSTALFFSYLGIVNPTDYWVLIQEDGWVENLTAASLFLAGLLLLATAWMERNSVRRCIYILGGLAMVFGAGEEISWGQRIFGFATPDFLISLNYPEEFNVHNTRLGRRIPEFIRNASLLLCIVGLFAFFFRKDNLFGIPLPSILLTLCFLVVYPSDFASIVLPSFTNRILLDNAIVLLPTLALFTLILTLFTLFYGKKVFYIAAVSTLVLVWALMYARWSVPLRLRHDGANEIKECLFGLVCFFYAVELFSAHGPRVTSAGTLLHEKKKPGGRIAFGSSLPANVRLSMIKGAGALIVAGSIGLSVLGHFNPGMDTAAVEKGYSQIKAAKPIIRSVFDVYLIENQLIYFKAPCAPSDTRRPFFLDVIPRTDDTNALSKSNPKRVRQIGHDYFFLSGVVWHDATHAGGRCMAIYPLPDYDVAGIHTGYSRLNIRDGSRDVIWEGRWDG